MIGQRTHNLTSHCFSVHHTAPRLRLQRAHCSTVAPRCSSSSRVHAEHAHDQHQKQQQLQQQQQHQACSRRRWLQAQAAAALALAAAGSFTLPSASHAAAATTATASCELQTSSATGLKWCDVVVGDGALPIKSAFTKLNYTAKLASTGTVFDSTYQRKTPLVFKVGEHELIEALDVAVLGAEDIPPMQEGGKRYVVASPGPMQRQGTKSLLWVVGLSQALEEAGEMAEDGSPTSDLVFEVELLSKRRSRG